MNKQGLIFGAMMIGTLALIGKRTYDLVKLRKEQQVIDITVETSEDTRKTQ